MAEPKAENEPTMVERWLDDQRQWQRTVLGYLDAMTKNDDFLVHLGNAMRGSLLAGKPYPTAPAAPPPAPAADQPPPPPDERLDKVLFALHQLQGQVTDLQMSLDEMRGGQPRSTASPSPVVRKPSRPKARVKGVARARKGPKSAGPKSKTARVGTRKGRA